MGFHRIYYLLKMNVQCIIHFDGKGGEIKKITKETLAKITDIRKQWLSLSSPYKSFTEVAKKSYEFFADSDDLDSLGGNCGYHLACYRSFTDINKIERAKSTLANAGRKRLADKTIEDEETNLKLKSQKIARSTRQSDKKGIVHPGSRSSNVLPEICLVCKQPGPIYITEKVFFSFLISFID